MSGIITNVVVTRSTHACTELQMVEPRDLIQERFLGNVPSQTYRPERTVLVVCTETGRTIPSDSRIDDIFAVVRISGRTDVRKHTPVGCRSSDRIIRSGNIKRVNILARVTFTACRNSAVVARLRLHADQRLYLMDIIERLVVAQHVRPYPACTLCEIVATESARLRSVRLQYDT